MRIRRSVNRFFLLLVVPAVSLTVLAYFGNDIIVGKRGLLVMEDVLVKVGIEQEVLAQAQTQRERLFHRIQLMEAQHPDADLVEELARGQLMDGAPNQVAIPRSASNIVLIDPPNSIRIKALARAKSQDIAGSWDAELQSGRMKLSMEKSR